MIPTAKCTMLPLLDGLIHSVSHDAVIYSFVARYWALEGYTAQSDPFSPGVWRHRGAILWIMSIGEPSRCSAVPLTYCKHCLRAMDPCYRGGAHLERLRCGGLSVARRTHRLDSTR